MILNHVFLLLACEGRLRFGALGGDDRESLWQSRALISSYGAFCLAMLYCLYLSMPPEGEICQVAVHGFCFMLQGAHPLACLMLVLPNRADLLKGIDILQ
ncbi:hypothetical protein KP509_29G055600 [Ceratopteris richardii]|nr:hypothetical protein KP509_29G055600 [Ceratopteris richardii]